MLRPYDFDGEYPSKAVKIDSTGENPMTKTNEKANKTENNEVMKSMTADAVSIWSEPGEEAKRKEFPPALDITKHKGEAFRCEFVRREDYEYEYDGETRKGVAFVAKLIKTSSAACKEQEGKEISIYGKGLLNYQFTDLKVKEGDIFVVSCGEKQAIGGGKMAYQTALKVVKRA